MKPSVRYAPISSGRSSAEQPGLLLEVRARRVAERVALAAIARLEQVLARQLRRIREAPRRPQPRVQPLRRALRGLERQRHQRVRAQVLARRLRLVRQLADALARRRHEQRDVIALASRGPRRRARGGSTRSRQREAVRLALARERERLERHASRRARRCAACCRPAPPRRTATTARTFIAPRAALGLHRLDLALQLGCLHVAGVERLDEAAAEAQVAAVEHLRVDVAPHLVEVDALASRRAARRSGTRSGIGDVERDARARAASVSGGSSSAGAARRRVAGVASRADPLRAACARPGPSAGSACRARSSRRCSTRRCPRTTARSSCA